jgi:hypothetical protein
MQPVLARARDLSCSDSPECKPRHREYGDPVIVGEHQGCRMGSLVAMRGRIGWYSDRRRTIERGFGLSLSVVVVALQIGWFRTVLRCGASSGVGTVAARFSLDRSGSQSEKLIDFGSYDRSTGARAEADYHIQNVLLNFSPETTNSLMEVRPKSDTLRNVVTATYQSISRYRGHPVKRNS